MSFNLGFYVWDNRDRNTLRKVDDYTQENGFNIEISGGPDRVTFKISLCLNVKNNSVSGRNQFLGCGVL